MPGHAKHLIGQPNSTPLLESLGDPELTVSLSIAPMTVSLQGGRIAAALRLAQRVIELTGGRPTQGEPMTISPIGVRDVDTRYWPVVIGIVGLARRLRSVLRNCRYDTAGIPFWHVLACGSDAIPNGVLIPEPAALGKAAEIHSAAEQFGEEITVDLAKEAKESLSSIAKVQSATLVPDCSKSCMRPPAGSV